MHCGYPGQKALNHFKESVRYETAAGEKLVSSITSTSAENLGLKVGDTAYAVIKASSVMIAVD